MNNIRYCQIILRNDNRIVLQISDVNNNTLVRQNIDVDKVIYFTLSERDLLLCFPTLVLETRRRKYKKNIIFNSMNNYVTATYTFSLTTNDLIIKKLKKIVYKLLKRNNAVLLDNILSLSSNVLCYRYLNSHEVLRKYE